MDEKLFGRRGRERGVTYTIIWFSERGFKHVDSQRGPRVKVVLGDKITTPRVGRAASVMIETPPRLVGVLPIAVARKVTAFVERNRDVLLSHWEGEIDSETVGKRLRRPL